METKINRRTILQGAAVTATGLAIRTATAAEADAPFKISKGRIRQSVMGWCFNPMPTEELAKHCKGIGLVAMEGVGSEHYPMIQKLGLKISIVGSHGFKDGPCNRDNFESCLKKLRDGIDLAVKVNCPNVITFTGMRQKGVSDELASKNCVDCWKQVCEYAEEKKINLCLEHLNSRDDSHPMKGHPGYFGDDMDFCIDLIKKVDSPRMKILFDIYHVQVMNGDVIRRIRQYKDYIAHVHTAGNPGRGELDENQEINYPAVMRALLEIDYQGYVAQEFIPTWEDKIAALRHAASVCDV